MCIICTQKGFTALHVAAKYGHLEAMRLLLQDKRVDVNITGKNGLTPLHVATHYDNFDVIMMLMQHSANTHAVAKVGNSVAIVTLYNNIPGYCSFLHYKKRASYEIE